MSTATAKETASPAVSQQLTPPIFMMDLMAIVPYYTGYLCGALRGAGARVDLGSITYHLDRTFFTRSGLSPNDLVVDLTSKFTFPSTLLRRVLKVLECLLTMLRLLAEFRRERPAALHVQFLPMVGFGLPFERWFLAAANTMGIPLVYTVHNLLPHDSGTAHYKSFRAVYHLADALICHSDSAKSQLISDFDIDPARITVIPHGPLFEAGGTSDRGAARDRLGIDRHRPLVLWQGILRPYKGVPFLLDAWKATSRQSPDAQLAVVGNADDAAARELKAQVERLGIDHSVRLDIRFVTVQEVADYYVASDIIVFPYSEITTSGALMTAVSHGRAIVATRLPAFEQILRHGENALLVDYADVDQLASSLSELVSDTTLRDRLAAGAKTSYSECAQWPEIASETLAVYQRITAPSRAAHPAVAPGHPMESELGRLFRQSSHYVFGLLATMSVGFVSFPIFTRVFSVADFGLIDFAQKILLLLTAVSKLGMQNSAMRFYDPAAFLANPKTQRAYYSTMFFGVLASATAVTALFWIALRTRPAASLDAPLIAILSFASILIVMRALQSILWSFLRVEERTKTYNVTSFLMKAGSVAAVLVLLPLLGASVKTYYTATIAVESILVLVVAVPLFWRRLLIPLDFDKTLFRISFVFGAPLIFQELFGIILDSGDRGLVQYYLGANALGFYSVAYGLSTYLNTLLIAPLSLAITPIYLRLWRTSGAGETADFLSTALDAFLLAAFGVLLIVTLISNDAITILASSKYHGAGRLIPLIVAGLLLYTAQIFLNAGLMIHKRTMVMAGVLFVAATVNVVLNCLLLPKLGLQAAALSTFAGYGVCTVLLAYFAYKVLPLKLQKWSTTSYACSAAFCWFLLSRGDIHPIFLNLLLKSLAGASMYIAIVCALDSRTRANLASLAGYIHSRISGGPFNNA